MPDSNWPAPAILESPALFRGEAGLPAYEVKFLLTESEVAEVERWLRPRLTPDRHAEPALGGAYQVTSVYFDTAGLDVYRRSETFRRRKYRVRRYGSAPTVYLERKTKKDQRVRKRRTAVPFDGLAALVGADWPDWPGTWFARQLAGRSLGPVCRVSYLRRALVGTCHDGPIRVTFDRLALGAPAAGPAPRPVADGKPLLDGEVITELKFLGAMPTVFKDVVEGMKISPRPVSKYRRCVEAVGLAAEKTDA